MTPASQNDLILRATRGEKTPYTPIWLMRQAGRTDPEYVKLRTECGLSLERLFRHPELAARISLLPKRYGVDAIIFFQDILTPLSPMGADFIFDPGPQLQQPITSARDLDRLHTYDVVAELPFIRETFQSIHDSLNGALPVLGFAGAPLTLAVFIIEGKSFGKTAARSLQFLRDEPDAMHRLLDRLTEMTIDYLKYQIAVGAAAAQVFESSAHVLTREQYREFALPYQQRILAAIRGLAPTIMFAHECNDIELLDAAGADVISLPSAVSLKEARNKLGAQRIFQGNLDNHLLAAGSKDEIASAARACVLAGEHRGHIFNLSHGLLRETPLENILHLIQTVHETVCDDPA